MEVCADKNCIALPSKSIKTYDANDGLDLYKVHKIARTSSRDNKQKENFHDRFSNDQHSLSSQKCVQSPMKSTREGVSRTQSMSNTSRPLLVRRTSISSASSDCSSEAPKLPKRSTDRSSPRRSVSRSNSFRVIPKAVVSLRVSNSRRPPVPTASSDSIFSKDSVSLRKEQIAELVYLDDDNTENYHGSDSFTFHDSISNLSIPESCGDVVEYLPVGYGVSRGLDSSSMGVGYDDSWTSLSTRDSSSRTRLHDMLQDAVDITFEHSFSSMCTNDYLDDLSEEESGVDDDDESEND